MSFRRNFPVPDLCRRGARSWRRRRGGAHPTPPGTTNASSAAAVPFSVLVLLASSLQIASLVPPPRRIGTVKFELRNEAACLPACLSGHMEHGCTWSGNHVCASFVVLPAACVSVKHIHGNQSSRVRSNIQNPHLPTHPPTNGTSSSVAGNCCWATAAARARRCRRTRRYGSAALLEES